MRSSRLFHVCSLLIAFSISETVGINLECDFMTDSWTYIPNGMVCTGQRVTITSKQTITSINSQENYELSHTQPQMLSIHGQTVHYFPRGLKKFFSNLQGIQIHSSGLKTIHSTDLEPFHELKYLDLQSNNLKFLESDLFQFNPNLQLMNFYYNQLSFIGTDILESLQSLERADFNYNKCISDSTHGRYGISSLQSQINNNCPLPEDIKPALCYKDIKNLKEKHEKELTALRNEISRLNQFNELHKSCEGNLNAATKNLQIVSKTLDQCKVFAKDFSSSPDNENQIDMICNSLSDAEVCDVIDLEIPFNFTSIEKVKDENGKVIQTQNITKLHVDIQQTLFLPSNIADHFPNLSEISVTASGLYSISLQIFDKMNNLKVLNLTDNKLLEIPVEAFNELENLVQLDLSRNNIEVLQNDIFKSLLKLESLKLNGNKLIMINSILFASLTSLKTLFLQNNNIKFISANLLLPMTQIATMNLLNNDCINSTYPEKSLQTIENEIIDNCIAPIELTCDFTMIEFEDGTSYACKAQNFNIEYPKTKISKVVGTHLDDLTINNVTALEITNQSIKFMPFVLATKFPNLQKLSIEHSNLTSLQNFDFDNFTQLTQLMIKNNNLTTVDKKTFDNIEQLTHLDLSFNNIQSLPSKIFSRLIHLKTLILSNNKLKSFTANLLPMRNSIETLKADNNELELVETKILRYLRKSKLIDLTENVCIDLKFDKTDKTSKTLIELSGEIDLNCSLEDSECNC